MSQRYKYSIPIEKASVSAETAMSQRVKQHWALINFLTQHMPLFQLKAILSILNAEQINTIGEIALNTLYGILPIKSEHKVLLKKYSDVIEAIGDKKRSNKYRKELIVNNPKAIVLLLTAAKPTLQTTLK